MFLPVVALSVAVLFRKRLDHGNSNATGMPRQSAIRSQSWQQNKPNIVQFPLEAVDWSRGLYRAAAVPRESTMFKGFRAAIAIAVVLVPAVLVGMHAAVSQNTPKLHRMVLQVSREDTEGMNLTLANAINAK